MPPRFPRAPIVVKSLKEYSKELDKAKELFYGTTTTASESCAFLNRFKKRRAKRPPRWKLDLVKALTNLVEKHHLRIDCMGEVCSKFCPEMVSCFVKLTSSAQLKQLKSMVGNCSRPLSDDEA